MTDLRERMAQKVWDIISDHQDAIGLADSCDMVADAAIALMVEECAKVVEHEYTSPYGGLYPTGIKLAAAIRALAKKEGEV